MSSVITLLSRLNSELWTYSLISLLIAHIIADFALRCEFLKHSKKGPTQRAGYHLLVFAVISFGLLIINRYLYSNLIQVVVLVVGCTVGHWLIDTAFTRTSMWCENTDHKQRWLFILQQTIKGLMLIAVAVALTIYSSAPDAEWHFSPKSWHSLRVLAYIFGYLFALYVGDAFVSVVLTRLAWKPDKKSEGVPGAGRIIGVFEALLITTFVLSYQYSAIGLALTAKSVARFEWLKDQKKTEYFLIGTLSNLIVAVLAGILTLWLAGQPVFPRQGVH